MRKTVQNRQSLDLSATTVELPVWLPSRAKLFITHQDEHSISGEARLGRRRIAHLTWTPDYKLLWERPIGKNGKPHGIEVEREEGRVKWCAQWVNGRMHGPAMQFDTRGRPILVTEFVRGVGVDIWMTCGKVSEVREMADGRPHGLVLWGNPRKPWCEERFWRGKRHGIWRTWEQDGRLQRGFPQFYVNDKLVTPARYDAARTKDDTLPPYSERDDVNRRPLPEAVRDALKRAKALRRDLAFVKRSMRGIGDHPAPRITALRATPPG